MDMSERLKRLWRKAADEYFWKIALCVLVLFAGVQFARHGTVGPEAPSHAPVAELHVPTIERPLVVRPSIEPPVPTIGMDGKPMPAADPRYMTLEEETAYREKLDLERLAEIERQRIDGRRIVSVRQLPDQVPTVFSAIATRFGLSPVLYEAVLEGRTDPAVFRLSQHTAGKDGIMVSAMPGLTTLVQVVLVLGFAYAVGRIVGHLVRAGEDLSWERGLESTVASMFTIATLVLIREIGSEGIEDEMVWIAMGVAAIVSFGRSAEVRLRFLFAGAAASCLWMLSTTPLVEAYPSFGTDMGVGGIFSWDILGLAALFSVWVVVALAQAVRGRSVTHVSVQSPGHRLVQDVRIVENRSRDRD
jgi:hypothetical protein